MQTQLSLADYWSDPLTWHYFKNLRLSIQYLLPGVFPNNPYPNAVNGSLWTIPYEFRWYLALMVLGLVGLLRHRIGTLFFVAGLVTFAWWTLPSGPDQSHRWSVELGGYFMVGVLLNQFQDVAFRWPVRATLVLGLGAFPLIAFHQAYLVCVVAVPYAAIALGRSDLPLLRRAGRWGDPSYGLYIYAFPVQQVVVQQLGSDLGFVATLVLCTLVTTVFAYASWHGVERPALQLKRYLSRPLPR